MSSFKEVPGSNPTRRETIDIFCRSFFMFLSKIRVARGKISDNLFWIHHGLKYMASMQNPDCKIFYVSWTSGSCVFLMFEFLDFAEATVQLQRVFWPKRVLSCLLDFAFPTFMKVQPVVWLHLRPCKTPRSYFNISYSKQACVGPWPGPFQPGPGRFFRGL